MFDQLVHDEALYACEHQRELFLNTVVKFGKTFQMILPLQKQNEPVNFLALSWHMDLERSVCFMRLQLFPKERFYALL